MGASRNIANMGDSPSANDIFLSANTVALATAGTERMRIDSSGNIGIGTSSPSSKLDVSGQIQGSPIYIKSGGSTSTFFYDSALLLTQSGTGERMRIDSSGNVGIGTSAPGAKLDVSGNINVRGGVFSEGGEVALYNPDTTTVGAILDVSGADVTRWFTTRNNTLHQIGQLVGTGGTVSVYTAAAERMRIDASGNLLFNSGYGSVATAYGCRAWVNFNGTGVVAIRASGNVTSITDNNTGDYTVNFTTALPDANYSSVAGCAKNDGNNDGNHTAQVGGFVGGLQTASACRIRTVYITGFASQDSPQVTFAAFR